MTNTSPQGKTKDNAPWPIVVNRQSLLTASWGSKKGADLLWHFLNKARWEIKNQNLSTSVKVITFQEERPEIFDSIKSAKAGNSISQGTYNTLLRDFVAVGYLVNQPYSDLFEVHLDVIENAFSNPPQRPVKNGKKPKSTHEIDVNLTHHNIDTISREEFNSLVQVCVNVSEMCQCLSKQVAELTLLCQSLTQNPSSNNAQKEASHSTTEVQSNALEITLNDNANNAVCANAPTGTSASDPSEKNSYSQEDAQTDLQEESSPKDEGTASGGYMQKTPVNEPPKPVKPASRQRKPKVEQPVLVDTSKKAVAYNEAEQRVFDWYCGCDFIHAKPEQDANKKKHCGKLALHVHSQEEMQSLADFTKTWVKEHFKQNVYVVPLGNMAYSDTLNAWIAKQKQVKRASEPAAPQAIDLNKPVLWTRYQHTGPAIKHWFLYEDMPLAEAQQYGYKPDVIVPNDRRNIHTLLKAFAEGYQTLTPEEQNEKDHAELRLHLVA